MSEEMVERVARALADGAHCPSQCSTYCGDTTACVAHAAARAAIEAMRGPTEAMVKAADLEALPGGVGERGFRADIETEWDAMITAALK